MQPQPGTRPERSTLDEFLGRQPSSEHVRRLRKAAPAVGLLLLAGLAALYFTGRSSDQPNYATTPVQRGDLRVTVSATGNLQPTNEVEVGSELSGLVTEVNVDNNDRVTRGQVLARIDTARLQDSIAQSRASLQSAIANVAQAEATTQQTRASLARFNEVRALSGGKVPSAADLDTARA
jgi:HlyD family secretion protein